MATIGRPYPADRGSTLRNGTGRFQVASDAFFALRAALAEVGGTSSAVLEAMDAVGALACIAVDVGRRRSMTASEVEEFNDTYLRFLEAMPASALGKFIAFETTSAESALAKEIGRSLVDGEGWDVSSVEISAMEAMVDDAVFVTLAWMFSNADCLPSRVPAEPPPPPDEIALDLVTELYVAFGGSASDRRRIAFTIRAARGSTDGASLALHDDILRGCLTAEDLARAAPLVSLLGCTTWPSEQDCPCDNPRVRVSDRASRLALADLVDAASDAGPGVSLAAALRGDFSSPRVRWASASAALRAAEHEGSEVSRRVSTAVRALTLAWRTTPDVTLFSEEWMTGGLMAHAHRALSGVEERERERALAISESVLQILHDIRGGVAAETGRQSLVELCSIAGRGGSRRMSEFSDAWARSPDLLSYKCE